MTVKVTRYKGSVDSPTEALLAANGKRTSLLIYAVDGDLLVAFLTNGKASDIDADDIKISQGRLLPFNAQDVISNELWIKGSGGAVKYIVYESLGG